jgi:hypothetical protein
MTSTTKNLTHVDLVLDSTTNDNRDSPTFTLDPDVQDVVGFCWMWVRIPFTYYVIDETCNEFEFNGLLSRIKPGTYNPLTLQAAFQNAIRDAGQVNAQNYSLFVSNSTDLLSIWSLSPFVMRFNSQLLADIFGFTLTNFYGSELRTAVDQNNNPLNGGLPVNILTGQNPAELNGPEMINVNCNDFRDGERLDEDRFPILAAVPVEVEYKQKIVLWNYPEIVTRFRRNVSNIRFNLTLGKRSTYEVNGIRTSYLPLNGKGFQVKIRLYVLSNIVPE